MYANPSPNRRIYVDTRLHTLLDLSFNQPFFQRGDFPEVISNGSGLAPLPNPWINGTYATPFDQGIFLSSRIFFLFCYLFSSNYIEFYFIMNVAVGSTNGWFPDGQGNKPWLNNAGSMFFFSSKLYHIPFINLLPFSELLFALLIRPISWFYNKHEPMVPNMAFISWRSCYGYVSLFFAFCCCLVLSLILNGCTVTTSRCGNIVERNYEEKGLCRRAWS